MKRLGILTSRSGRNASNIIRAVHENKINSEIACIIGNSSYTSFINDVSRMKYPSYFLNHNEYPTRDHFDSHIADILEKNAVDIVVSCSFSRILTRKFLDSFPISVNSHPSLLPAFPGRTLDGKKPVDAAFDYGVKFVGATVHFIDHHVDSGPIIIQGIIPVTSTSRKSEILGKVLQLEDRIKVQALAWLANEEIETSGRNVYFPATLNARKEGFFYNDGCLISPNLDDGF